MITIFDYDIGNIGSIANALNKLRVDFKISADSKILSKTSAIILPGVGSANEGMKKLKERKLNKLLKQNIQNGKPLLGICLGMQLLFEFSEEGNTKCLGIIKGKVKKFQKMKKIPQIGWNNVEIKKYDNEKVNQLSQNIPNNSYFYFVNSYYCIPKDKSIVIGTTKYGEQFASIIVKDNIMATQFHPEKSGKIGYILLKNFLEAYRLID